jgi:rRNA maturation endonuclease Nob1
MSKMKKTRKPGGGRKKLKPEYDAGKNLKEQMESAVELYDSEMSLQSIADALNLMLTEQSSRRSSMRSWQTASWSWGREKMTCQKRV